MTREDPGTRDDSGPETSRQPGPEPGENVLDVGPEGAGVRHEQPVTAPGEPSAAPAPETAASETQTGGVRTADAKKVYCVRCGTEMRADDRFCRNCGWDTRYLNAPLPQPPPRAPLPPNTSDRNRLTTLLLCVLLGWLGVHRFYVGKTGTGILWLLTLGLLGIGMIFDLVMIATGEFKDAEGRPILRWE